SISQDYGVKLSKLYKKNLLNIGEEPAEGATISLRRNSKIKPKLRSTKEIKDQKKDHIVDVSADQSEEISLQEDVVGTRIPAPKESKSLSNTIEVQKEEVGINYHPFNYHPNSSYRFNLIESSEGAVFHMVQQGDTLYNVSKRYNVSVEQLKEWNEMNGNDIQIQQQLIIYNQ
ncbi:MAG TPA: LysM peptidoglycan-binding domain-containing protein, partial [Chitinophagales bacterium]|nr:LysM peptidoglycan-binding domain-containing protein [Chitinophagales bacterium]